MGMLPLVVYLGSSVVTYGVCNLPVMSTLSYRVSRFSSCGPIIVNRHITLPSLATDDNGSDSKCSAKQAAVVMTEGLPPVSTKLLQKIQNWEFVELAS